MEHIATLPETNKTLSPTIIPLFGLLTSVPVEKKEDCHICFETIRKGQLMVIQLPCCNHYVHADCFKTWASTSHTESVVRCAYCRSIYHYEDKCFLCLSTIHDNENLTCTNCCHSKIHSECAKELNELVTLLTFEHSLECGHIVHCYSLWIDV